MRRLVIGALVALCLSGCSQSLSNRPWGAYPTYENLASNAVVQVDQNGDFYPDHWQTEVGDLRVARARSIAGALPPEDRAARLSAYRDRALERVRRAVEGRSRVFVLIHGFNAEPGSAGAGADIVKQTLALTASDAVIEMNWDGLRDAGGFANGGVIWFPSVTTSQQAGTNALRPILAQLSDRRVVFITHSRGASVVLSAFSNPNYRSKYKRETDALGFGNLLSPPEIDFSRRGMEIDAIFLAPAIGEPDFWSPECVDTDDCQNFRMFPGLRSIRYTVNPGDPILQKRFFNWNPVRQACRLNPTALGVGDCVDDAVKFYEQQAPGLLHAYAMTPMNTHSYICYAAHPEFRQMLADIGIDSRGGLARDVPPPVTCDPAFRRPPAL